MILEGDAYSFEGWVKVLREMLENAASVSSPADGLLTLPGGRSSHGKPFDDLEGFARNLLGLGALASSGTMSVDDPLASVFREGIQTGVTNSWPAPTQNSHACVEAASISVALTLAPDFFWHPLDTLIKHRLRRWLLECAAHSLYNNNWQLFPLIIHSFLISVDAEDEDSQERIIKTEKLVSQWYDGSGWYSDGPGRIFDYYNSWGFHFYLGLAAKARGDRRKVTEHGRVVAEFIRSLRHFVNDDGSPIYFGRSLTYRFGIATAFCIAPLTAELTAEQQRICGMLAARVLSRFIRGGSPSENGSLKRGWFGESSSVAEPYSGPAGSYWALKFFVALGLARDSQFWEGVQLAGEGTVPIPQMQRSAEPPGMIAFRTPGTPGIARLINHGSYRQSSKSGRFEMDVPAYSRVEYSSATAPLTTELGRDRGFLLKSSDTGHEAGRGIPTPWRSEHSARIAGANVSYYRPLNAVQRRLQTLRGASRLVSFLDRPTVAHVQEMSVASGRWTLNIFGVSPIAREHGGFEALLGGWAVGEGASADQNGARLLSLEVPLLGFSRRLEENVNAPGPFGQVTRLCYLSGDVRAAKDATVWFCAAISLSNEYPEDSTIPKILSSEAHYLRIELADTIQKSVVHVDLLDLSKSYIF